jgi:hypothetical protein
VFCLRLACHVRGPRFNNYKDGFRFGQLGYDLVEKRGLTRYQARIWMNMGDGHAVGKHVASGRELVRRAFDAAYRIGDLTFRVVQLGSTGHHLSGSRRSARRSADGMRKRPGICEKSAVWLVIELCGSQLGLIRTLRGVTPTLGSLDHDDYREPEVERDLASNPNLVFAEFYYWTRKVQARFFAGDYATAADAAFKGRRLYGHQRQCSKRRTFASMLRLLTQVPGMLRHLKTDRNTSRP